MSNAPMLVAGLALAAGLGGLALALQAGDRTPAPAEDGTRAAVDELRTEIDRLQGSVEAAVTSRRDRGAALDDALARLDRRIAALEERPVPAAATRAEEAPEPGPAVEELTEEAARRKEFEDLLAKVMDDSATPDEETRFWKLARSTDLVDELVTEFEGKVGTSPADVDVRMDLARAYVAKLLSIPGGPEQGAWAMKAEGQWREVIKLDEDHWEANYSIGESWSWYPEQLGKTPDAINQFEKVRKIQEGLTPEKQHVGTYLRLAMLYGRQSNTKMAREALIAGLSRHPDDERLKKQLETMGEGGQE
jgi:TolA-binding protein